MLRGVPRGSGTTPANDTRLLGRLQPKDATEMRRDAYRAGEIGADVKGRHLGSYRRRRAATGAPRGVLQIPRVVGAAKDRIIRLKVGQHRWHIRLADEDTPSSLEAGRDGAILLGQMIGQRREPDRGAHPGGRMGILQREGHAVERSPDHATGQGCIRFPRPCIGTLGIQGNDGIQGGVMFRDLRQMCFKHFSGRNLTGPDGSRQVRRAGEDNAHDFFLRALHAARDRPRGERRALRSPHRVSVVDRLVGRGPEVEIDVRRAGGSPARWVIRMRDHLLLRVRTTRTCPSRRPSRSVREPPPGRRAG